MMKKLLVVVSFFSAGLASFVLVAACTSSNNLGTTIDAGTDSDGDVDTGISYIQPGETPDNHFPTAPICRTTRPPVTPDAGDSGIDESCFSTNPCCASDSDCVDGGPGKTNGRCAAIRGKTCTWDECVTSSDCSSNTICSCAGDDPNETNQCVLGNCRTDSDCGPSGFCSRSVQQYCGIDDVTGIYCHTPDDKCLNDSDCASVKNSAGESAACAFDGELKRWQCVLPGCAG